LRSFPNETLIFPSHEATLEDLLFVKTLDPKNQILDIKIEHLKEAIEQGKFSIPTSLFEEKQYNPYMRLSEKYYIKLLEESNQGKALKKLKLLQENYFN
jgi:hydroxyacylglutathione hydrolase